MTLGHKKRHKKPSQKWILIWILTSCLVNNFKMKRTIKSCLVKILQEWTTSATVVTWILLYKCLTVYHRLRISIMNMVLDILKIVNLSHPNVSIAKHQKYSLDWIMVNTLKKDHELELLTINKSLKSINQLSVLMILSFWLLKIILSSDQTGNKMLKNICNFYLIGWQRKNQSLLTKLQVIFSTLNCLTDLFVKAVKIISLLMKRQICGNSLFLHHLNKTLTLFIKMLLT